MQELQRIYVFDGAIIVALVPLFHASAISESPRFLRLADSMELGDSYLSAGGPPSTG